MSPREAAGGRCGRFVAFEVSVGKAQFQDTCSSAQEPLERYTFVSRKPFETDRVRFVNIR